ncbi:MAG: NADH-quinone oxidoreductase subunit NuoE [Thermodesulfobacteriales bacterium]|jgi:NADH-quinone oxidoreductase subunit E|nr:MAG: NADH-quinone oxidoreductase subunit NuoE [Thermodesulfobacteriales bacterium]
MPFSETLTKKLNAIVSKSETKRSALIPVLREIQNEYGYLSAQSMEEAATMLEISPSSVQNVATFYTMFFTEPAGKHIVWVCRTLSCALRGAEHVEHYMCDKLGIKTGETTPDGKITLMEAECLASCGTAPVMLVDNTLEENLTKARVDQVIQELRED